MSILWSLVIVAGLLILVYLMIAGVPRVDDGRGIAAGSLPKTLLPMLGAMGTLGGIAGYLTTRWAVSSAGLRWIIVVGTAVASAILARILVRMAFAAPSNDPEDDPRYRYQGHVARITRAISADRPGQVSFEIDGRHFDLAAQSIDGNPIATGTEVVIERIDDDLATVELWAIVEERL